MRHRQIVSVTFRQDLHRPDPQLHQEYIKQILIHVRGVFVYLEHLSDIACVNILFKLEGYLDELVLQVFICYCLYKLMKFELRTLQN